MRAFAPVVVVLLLLGLGACTRQAHYTPITVPTRDPATEARVQRALAARDALGKALLGELQGVIQARGPEAAIEVCHDRAGVLAREVAAREGVAIGRTSFRRRTPDNAPPAWAAELVEARAAEAVYLRRDDGALAALLPIQLQPVCVTCHGLPEEIPPTVRAALARTYPLDQATGFRVGDLRGWFWVEVP